MDVLLELRHTLKINRLINKGMSNIYLVIIEKN